MNIVITVLPSSVRLGSIDVGTSTSMYGPSAGLPQRRVLPGALEVVDRRADRQARALQRLVLLGVTPSKRGGSDRIQLTFTDPPRVR